MVRPDKHAGWLALLAMILAGGTDVSPLAGQHPANETAWASPGVGQPELLPPPQERHFAPSAPLAAEAGWGMFPEGSMPQEVWPPLVPPWLARPWFAYSDPNDPHRHVGLGQPLIGTSWRNRPWFAGAFVGGVLLDDLVSNQIYQNDTSFVGLRLGYDFDHFFGMEGRWAFARPDLTTGGGEAIRPASRDYFADLSLLYYPLGDARWRPYLSAGLGFQTFRFNTAEGQRISESVLQFPLGAGLKYYYSPWFTLRMDVTDNLSVGNARLSGMHNWSFTAGAEFRFGGTRPSYFPWHTNTSYW